MSKEKTTTKKQEYFTVRRFRPTEEPHNQLQSIESEEGVDMEWMHESSEDCKKQFDFDFACGEYDGLYDPANGDKLVLVEVKISPITILE